MEQNVSKLSSRVEGVVKVQEEEREQLILTSTKKMTEAREKSLALISGQQPSIPSAVSSIGKPQSLSIPEYKPEFAPGAPPPDTPENPPIGAPSMINKLATSGRPKLKDYLAARKEGPKEENDQLPGVRPPPVGSEAEPDITTHSLAATRLAAQQGQYPGMQGPPANMQFSNMPGQYAGMTSYQGMAYPPNFYQNPQFAAMYAQSLNMVKGLQGGGNAVSSATSVARTPAVSTTTASSYANEHVTQGKHILNKTNISAAENTSVSQPQGQNMQQQQGQNMQQQQGKNMQQQQGQNINQPMGQNSQQQQGQNLQLGQNVQQQQGQNIQHHQKPIVQMQGQNVQPHINHPYGQNFHLFQGQNVQQYQKYQLQQAQGHQTNMPPGQQTQMPPDKQVYPATSQQQSSYQQQQSQFTQANASAAKTIAGQQIHQIYSSGYNTIPNSLAPQGNVIQTSSPAYVQSQQAYLYSNRQPLSGSYAISNKTQLQQQTQQANINQQNYLNYHSSPQHPVQNLNNSLAEQSKMNPVVPQPGSIQHQDGMLQQGQFNTNNNKFNKSVSTNQNANSATSSYMAGENISIPSTIMANTYGMTQTSQGQETLNKLYSTGQQRQIYQQRTGQNQLGMGIIQQMIPGFVEQITGQVRQKGPGTIGQQMTEQVRSQISGQIPQQIPTPTSKEQPGQNVQQIPGQVRPQFQGYISQQMPSQTYLQKPGQVIHQMPGQISQLIHGQVRTQTPKNFIQQTSTQVVQKIQGQDGLVSKQIPGQVGQQMPGQMGQQMPGQVGQQILGQVGQQMPGQVGQQMPGHVGQQMPGQVGHQMPGQVGQQMPGHVGQQMPGQVGQQMPGQVGQQMPGQVGQQIFGQVGQQMLGQVGQQMPGQGVQQMPGQMGQQMHGQVGQQIPGQGGKQMPGQGVQQMTGHLSQQMPGQVVQQFPGQGGQQSLSGHTQLHENKITMPGSGTDSNTKPGSNLDLLSGLSIDGNRSESQISSATNFGISYTNSPQQENGVNLSSGNKKPQDPELQSYVYKEKLQEVNLKKKKYYIYTNLKST